MNKFLRIFLVLAVLAGLIAAVGFQKVWANQSAAANATWTSSSSQVEAGVSTVLAPGCNTDVPVDQDVSSMCGVATIVSENGKLIGRSRLGNRPDGFKNKMVIVDLREAGSANLCFGAKDGGVIYFYNIVTEKWEPLFTVISGGIACAQISQSGNYVLGK